MPITYAEIEEKKSGRIFVFFTVVVLFYFLAAIIAANIGKAVMILTDREKFGDISFLLTLRENLWLLLGAFLLGIAHSAYSVNNGMRLIQENLGTAPADEGDRYHKAFESVIDQLNVATGGKYKVTAVIIPTVALNAFAISDRKRNAVIGVTEGLLSKLNRRQLEAVIAHEFGHVVSGDSFQNTVGCALFGVYAAILGGMGRIMGLSKKTNTGNKKNNIEVEIGGIGLAVFAVYLTIAVMQFFYDLIRLFVSRDREYRADAIAVRLTRDPLALAEALHIISRGWRGLGPIDRNIESIFIINPANNTMDEKEGFLADLFSTHPPIKKRIAALAALAHESIENVKKTAEASLTEDEAAAPEKSDYEPAWMVQGPDALWLGPFNVMQLAALGWLRPDTWIRPEGTDKLITAAEDVLLKPILERMFKGNKEHALECPRCKVGLVEEEYEGAMSFRCLFCGGMLTDETMLQRFLIRREKKFSPRIMKLAEQTQKDGIGMLRAKQALQSDLKCPACANPMIRSFQTPAYLVQTDKCVPCKLVWFDKDELEIFQYLVENKKSAVI